MHQDNNQERALKRTLPFAFAFVLLVVIACTGQVQISPTATSTELVGTAAPTEAPDVVALVLPTIPATQPPDPTALPQSTDKTGTAASTPESTDAPSIPPEIFDTAAVPVETPPPHHFETSDEALAAATELGCTGFTTATLGEILYYRACADDEQFESVTAGTVLKSESTSAPVPIVKLPTLVAPRGVTPTVESTPAIAHEGPATDPTPPPYHYETVEDALTGATELGCSGWQGVSVGTTSYYRACGDTAEYDLLASGSGVTLSGNPCTLESDPTVRFTSAPTDLSLIRAILSSGTAAGGVIKPHSYLFNNNSGSAGGKVRVPIYAVADSFVSAIAYYNTSVDTSEYLIFFDVNCEISFKYDHIAEVVPKLLAVAPATPAQGSQTTRTDLIPFKAGELVGYTSGAGGVGPWDFGAYDLTIMNQFANQERYVKGRMKQLLHTVCPYEYFVEPLRSQMLAKIGTYDGPVGGNPTCYTTERDVLGAATGAWFDSAELTFQGASLSIALTDGYEVGITGIGSDMRVPTISPTYLDPDLLTTSHCYADSGRWIYLEVRAEGMQMALAEGSGSCPATLPAGALIYYR